MKPTELDLNLDGMRADALRKMIGAIRTALQECDDIEAMARVLHSQASTAIKAKVHANGNGNGLDRRQLIGPHRKKHSKHSDKNQTREAALIAIDRAGEDGIDSISLASLLIANGVLPATMTRQSAITAVRMALAPLAAQKRIATTLHRAGKTSRRIYYKTGNATTEQPGLNTVEIHGNPEARINKLRAFLTSALADSVEPVPVSVLHQIAIEKAGFDAKWGKGDTLRNQMGRVLREMLGSGMVKRFGKGREGRGGIPYTYVIVRPKLSVSRSAGA